jgi:uncharacterized protein YndB with AHSA1/START domain
MTEPQTAAASLQDAPATEIDLHIERHFAARPERVFQALTDPSELVRWWGPEGFTVPECELDARPGGAWRTCMRSPDGNLHCVSGVYQEIVPPKRLVYTWSWETEGPRHETLVTIVLRSVGDATELTMTQSLFDSLDSRDKHAYGWTGAFDCLVDYLAEGASA